MKTLRKLFIFVIILTVVLSAFSFNVLAESDPVTWNPSDKGSNVTLTNGNLTIAYDTYVNSNIRATHGKSTGKWYWEITCDSNSYRSAVNIGVAYKSEPITSYIYPDFNGNGFLYRHIYRTAPATYGLAMDIEARTLTVFKDGVLATIVQLPETLSEALFPIIGDDNSGASAVYTANFGATAFKYPIPEGYLAFNTPSVVAPTSPTNLAAIPANTQVALSWDSVTDATSYNIKRAITTGGPYETVASAQLY